MYITFISVCLNCVFGLLIQSISRILRVVMHKTKSQSAQRNNVFGIMQQTKPQGHKSAQMFHGYKTFLSDCKSAVEASVWMPSLIRRGQKKLPHVSLQQAHFTPPTHTVCSSEARFWYQNIKNIFKYYFVHSVASVHLLNCLRAEVQRTSWPQASQRKITHSRKRRNTYSSEGQGIFFAACSWLFFNNPIWPGLNLDFINGCFPSRYFHCQLTRMDWCQGVVVDSWTPDRLENVWL